MDSIKKINLIKIEVKGKEESFYLLKDIQSISKNFIKEVSELNEQKSIKDYGRYKKRKT